MGALTRKFRVTAAELFLMKSVAHAGWLGCTVLIPHSPAVSVALTPLIFLQPMGFELRASCGQRGCH